MPSSRGDEAKGGSGPDQRVIRPRELYHPPFTHGPRAEFVPETRDFR